MRFLDKIYPFSLIQTKLLVLCLMLMLLDYGGYGYYVFFLSLAFLWYHKVFKLIDKTFFLLLFWGLSYGIILLINNSPFNYGTILVPIINCPVLYLAGKYIVKQNGIKSLPHIIFVFALSLAFISILSVFIDIQKNGFLTTAAGRNIPFIGLGSLSTIAATGISSRLMPLVLFFICVFLPIDKKVKILIVACSILALICGVRIQSRTLILSLTMGVIIVALTNWSRFTYKQKNNFLIIFIFVIFIVIYIFSNYSSELRVIERFQSEELESGGGRSYRLMAVARNMFTYPLGNMPSRITFAHNMWFDCARVVGIFPFSLLVMLSIVYAKNVLLAIRKMRHDILLRNIIIFQSFLLLVVFFSEPILEGIPMLFQYFCLLYGMVSIFNKGKNVV